MTGEWVGNLRVLQIGGRWFCFWRTGATKLPFQLTQTIPNRGVASFQGSLCDESQDRPR